MIEIPRKKVAIIPIYDSNETKGGIIRPSSMITKTNKAVYEILDAYSRRKLDETDDQEQVRKLMDKYSRQGIHVTSRKKNIETEGQFMDAGERCDQGVVKYIGKEVVDTQIGDYVFFSGYSGTLVQVEGEGKLIILPESFIEFKMDIDKFIQISGLYFKDKHGGYFPATYEQAMNIIAENFTEQGLTYDVTPQQPKYEDYNIR